jgi:hypothetical protein
MDDHSFNLGQPYYTDAYGIGHYDCIKGDGKLCRALFVRTVALSGISVTINTVTAIDGTPTDQVAIDAVTNEIQGFQGQPLNGNECVALGYTYLGHLKTHEANIKAAQDQVQALGFQFKSIYYMAGYFVIACLEAKLFYDQG